MMRRMVVGGVTAAMFLVLLAACGGTEASPSASAAASAPAEVPADTEAPASEEPVVDPGASATTGAVRMTALCAGVGIRKTPATDGALVVRVAKGTTVRVVETVTGDPYEAGACGSSGDDWLKIDRVAGKSVSRAYGVPYVYAAGGFFE